MRRSFRKKQERTIYAPIQHPGHFQKGMYSRKKPPGGIEALDEWPVFTVTSRGQDGRHGRVHNLKAVVQEI